MSGTATVLCDTDGAVSIVTIDRPAARNAVNPPTARALAEAFAVSTPMPRSMLPS